MATYVEICNKAAKETGEVSGANPISTVTGQTGFLADICRWVSDTWKDLQLERDEWMFRRKDIEAVSLTADLGVYTKTAFASYTDVADYVGNNADHNRDAYSIYDPAEGVADEGALLWMPWEIFRRTYRRGSQTSNRPKNFSIDPQGRLNFGPVPDKAYVMNGVYIRDAQILTDDGDTPICPENYHDVIVWGAVLRSSEHDEADTRAIALAERRHDELMKLLRANQLPAMTWGGHPVA